MEQNGFDQEVFEYVKRRGRIYIIYAPGIQFGYLRKKHTHITPTTKQWEHGATFKVQVNESREIDVEDWSEVVSRFDQWLSTSCG